MAFYVYGIMRARDAADAVAAADASGTPIEMVDHEGLGAVVGRIPDGELRLRRDNILGHADVLQAAFEHGPVLPFRFGTAVADAEAVVRDVLAPSLTRLTSRLDALDGKAEMQVKAVYAEQPLLRSILARDRPLARTVQRTQALPAAATHFERIRIGEAIAAAVQSRRAADEAALVGELARHAVAHLASPPHHERAVLNTAFLVERDELPTFDRTVEALSERRAPEIEFKLIGPMPAYSFADRDWDAPAAEVSARWA
jgi:hypothetical protein